MPHDSVAVAIDLPALPEAGGGIADYRFELLSVQVPCGLGRPEDNPLPEGRQHAAGPGDGESQDLRPGVCRSPAA